MVSIVVSAIARGWLFGEVFCQIVGMVNDGLTFVRFLMVLVFTLDRLFTVFMPFFYIKHGAKISAAMSATAWMGALIQVVNSLQGLSNCYAYLPTFKTCTAVTCSPACRVHVYTFVTLLQILGGMVPFALYLLLFWKAKKLEMKITPMEGIDGTASTTKQEKRVRTTYLILFIALVGTATPAFILYLTQFAFSGPPPAFLIILQILVGRTIFYLLTAIDPITIMWNRDVRLAVRVLKNRIIERARGISNSIQCQ